jgi:hypothetical protein
MWLAGETRDRGQGVARSLGRSELTFHGMKAALEEGLSAMIVGSESIHPAEAVRDEASMIP